MCQSWCTALELIQKIPKKEQKQKGEKGMNALIYLEFLNASLLVHHLRGKYIMFNMHLQYVHFLQRKYSLSSFNLLGHTAPAQAASLLLLGPFLDYWLTNKRIDGFDFNLPSVVSISRAILIYICSIIIPCMSP